MNSLDFEQLGFESVHTDKYNNEINLFKAISKFIQEEFDDVDNVTMIPNKTYLSILFFNVPKIRIKTVYNELYLHIPEYFRDLIQKSNIEATLLSDHYFRIKVTDINSSLKPLLSEIYEYCCRKYSDGRFDCCSMYLECSNRKTCCHEDQKFAQACGYKYIMKNGKIFYGINRNIG